MWRYNAGQGLYLAPSPAVEVDLTQETSEDQEFLLQPSNVTSTSAGASCSDGAPSSPPTSKFGATSLGIERTVGESSKPAATLSGIDRKVPSLTHYIKMDDGSEVKLFHLIYKSGENLLEQKIENNAKGVEQEKYSGADHLHRLNLMFPETLRYHPDVMSKRIKSYITQAKKHVEEQQKTGQGMLDDQNYSQQVFEETRIVNLLVDANKDCQPPKSKKVFTGAQARYYEGKEAPAFVGNLEEPDSCFLCGSEENLTGTDMGKACRGCLHSQGTGEESLRKIKAEANKRDEMARVERNKALFKEDNKETKSKTTKTGRKKKERFSDDDDDNDQKIGNMLLSRLATSEKKDQLQIEKLKLETEILRQKKIRLERGQDSE